MGKLHIDLKGESLFFLNEILYHYGLLLNGANLLMLMCIQL